MNANKVHIDCCVIHGCQFNNKTCPVVSGLIEQDGICSMCIDDIFSNKPNPGVPEQDRLMNLQRDKITSIFLQKNRKYKLIKINQYDENCLH